MAMEIREARRLKKDIVFRKIGVDVPLTDGSETAFSGRVPARALAVSNRFGITYFAHSSGFVVTRTARLVEVVQQARDGASSKTAQQGCYLDVPIPDIHILSLSKDELTLAVCVGNHSVHLYDVPSLVHKADVTPLELQDIPEGHVKDLSWCPADNALYFLLSKEGQVFTGQVGEKLKRVVAKGVVAASWSPDGTHIAYVTEDRSISVANSKFEVQHTISLPAKLQGDSDMPDLSVESLRWIRSDSMLVAYTQNNEDGEEEDCPLILLTSKNEDFAKEGGATTVWVFDDLFPSIDPLVIPKGSGPYMLTEYLKPWEMAIAANRRSIDDHIVILGWFSEEGKDEALNIELSNDSWIPRIELQENGDDNVLLGLAVDLTTVNVLLADPRDESGDTKLPACPVLMCLSLGGKLSLFSVARIELSAPIAELVSPPSALPESYRAKQSSKTSLEVVGKPPQPTPISKAPPGAQQFRNRQAEERLEDEPSISSGSETDREDDEVLSHFNSSGKGGKMTRVQSSSLSAKDVDSLPANNTTSMSHQQMPAASSSSSLTSLGGSSLSTVKSAPSGLNQIQPTAPSPQTPALLTRTVTQVQPSASQFSSAFKPASFTSQPTAGLKPAQSTGTSFFGQASNDRGSRTFTPQSVPAFPQPSLQPERVPQAGAQRNANHAAKTPAASPARPSGASETEQTFIVELEKVKKMADEVDNLMDYIEGRSQKTTYNQPPCFTKQSLNELGLGIRTLANNCKNVKERVEEERQGIQNLRDENLQVDSWRIYVQSLAEQVAENRHQDLWNQRKLAPDLDVKRKHVIKAEQVLKQQIATLEEHVHHLEYESKKKTNLKGVLGRSQSLQNLYSTVNGLLASADRLSEQVVQQMDMLNISTQPATAQKILKSVGLSVEDSPHIQIRPALKGIESGFHARHHLTYSPSSKPDSGLTTLATPPRRLMPSDSGVGAPSITRRSRDSMDGVQRALALAGGASPKTTIERARHTPTRQLDPPNTTSTSFVKQIRPRSFQESSEGSTPHPRQVRRVLSTQSGSVKSSPGPSAFVSTSENEPSYSTGPSTAVGTSLRGSHSPREWHDQQSGDDRPDPKRTVSRSASSFADKSGSTLATRFGPPPVRTASNPSPAVISSSTPSTVPPIGAFSSIPPSESLFKWANDRSSTSASSFSFVLTPAAPKASGTLETSGSMPSGKPASSLGAAQPSRAGFFSSAGPSSSSFSSSVFGSMSGNSGTHGFPKSGVEVNLKPALERDGNQEKVGFETKASSAGTSLFSSPSTGAGVPSNSLSRPLMGGFAAVENLPSAPLAENLSGNKNFSQKEDESEPKEIKPALPLTPPGQPSFNQSNVNKPFGISGTTSSTTVSSTAPIQLSFPPPPGGKPLLPVTQTTAAAPTIPNSQTQVSQLPSLLNKPASPPNLMPSSSPMGGLMYPPASSPTKIPSVAPSTQFVFPAATVPSAPFTVPSISTADPDEEDMEEEEVVKEGIPGGANSLGGFNLGGLGLGSTSAPSEAPKSNIFGSSIPFGTQQSSTTFSLSSPQGQLFRPASFNLPAAQSPPSSGGFGFANPTPPKSASSPFGSSFGGTSSIPSGGSLFGTTPGGSSPGFGSPTQPGASGFGQHSQLGPGQQALGSALGAFGQTRQMGVGLASPFGSSPSGGFASAPSAGGFAGAATGGGFANAVSGGGFASAASGGGFAGAATGGGFANAVSGGGFASAASGGGFAGAAGASAGGFAGLAGSGGGGFGAFSGSSGGGGGGFGAFAGGGVPAFGSSTSPPAQPNLFTQIRR